MGKTKQEIVDETFKKGKLITPSALEMLASGHIQNYTNDFIITEKNLSFFKILKSYTFKDVVTTDDFIEHFNQKYHKVKQIIVSRIGKNFISLDKLSNSKSEVFVIGIVKNIERQTDMQDAKLKIDIEDLTGAATIFVNQTDDIELDDVVGVQGIDGGKSLYNAKMLFPDVPLKQPAKGFGKLGFITGLGFSEVPDKTIDKILQELQKHNIDFLFVVGSTKDAQKLENYVAKYWPSTHVITLPSEKYPQKPEQFKLDNIISLANPSLIEINGIKILLISEFKLAALRKRQLKQSKVPADPLVIDEIPDLVACCFPTDFQVTNYKTTSIINVGSFLSTTRPVIVDLATREIEQVKADV